jgi:hypothetical protein
VSILFRFHALRKFYLKESPGSAPRTPNNLPESKEDRLSKLNDSSNRLIDSITDQNCSLEVALQAINNLPAAAKVLGIFSRMGDFLKNSPEMKIYFFEKNRYSALQKDFFERYKTVLTREYQEALTTGKNIQETKARLISLLTGKLQPKAILDHVLPGNYSDKAVAFQKKQEEAESSAQKRTERVENDRLESLDNSSGGGGYIQKERSPEPQLTEKPEPEKMKLKSGASELLHSMRINPDKDPASAQKIMAGIEKIFAKTGDDFPESLRKIYENPSSFTDYFGNSQNVRAILESMLIQIRKLNIENINHSLFGGTESKLRPFKTQSLKNLLLQKPSDEIKKLPEFNNLKTYLKSVWKNYSSRLI